jgi:AcrR family transcriptional regulator
MVARTKETQLDKDATEFGSHVKAGGWRLGLLVARNVFIGTHGGDRSSTTLDLGNRVTAAEFAEKAGVSKQTVHNYYRAWELAADAGKVTHAELLSPDSIEDLDQMEDDDETDENRRQIWKDYLRQAIRGNKTKPEPKPEPELPKVDQTPEEIAEDEKISYEIDSSIMSSGLINLLEDTRVLSQKVRAVESVLNTRDLEILDEIEAEARSVIEAIEEKRAANTETEKGD